MSTTYIVWSFTILRPACRREVVDATDALLEHLRRAVNHAQHHAAVQPFHPGCARIAEVHPRRATDGSAAEHRMVRNDVVNDAGMRGQRESDGETPAPEWSWFLCADVSLRCRPAGEAVVFQHCNNSARAGASGWVGSLRNRFSSSVVVGSVTPSSTIKRSAAAPAGLRRATRPLTAPDECCGLVSSCAEGAGRWCFFTDAFLGAGRERKPPNRESCPHRSWRDA